MNNIIEIIYFLHALMFFLFYGGAYYIRNWFLFSTGVFIPVFFTLSFRWPLFLRCLNGYVKLSNISNTITLQYLKFRKFFFCGIYLIWMEICFQVNKRIFLKFQGKLLVCHEPAADTLDFEFFCDASCLASDSFFHYRFVVSPKDRK